jgi:hypothetical protein
MRTFFSRIGLLRGVLLLILLVIVLLVGLSVAGPLVGINLSPVRHRRQAVSEITLTEMRSILKIETIEYVYKTVFPHDFLPEDPPEYRDLYRRWEMGRLLTVGERDLLELYELCEELEIDLVRHGHTTREFVVLTCAVTAGFDLSGWSEEEMSRYIRPSPEENLVRVRLPDPQITSITYNDDRSDAYRYPDLAVTPEKWKQIVAFIEDRIGDLVTTEGILEEAARNGREIISEILSDTGYERIVFD